ncbi:glycosyltransferase [Streptomyces acidiscabies]|uniref:glycosyltransferase n=1 Tax=Streptomyces acidiscabies TaxID=42234 RepID=UPI00131CA0C1|nr:glycosyltransferase family 2 protein [Streptomyces acidiscabies]
MPLVLVFAPRPKWVRAREVYELPEVREPGGRVRYSLLVPAFHEPYLDAMFSYLPDPRRGDFEVLLLVHPDDDLTFTQARSLERIDPHRFRVVPVNSSPPRLAADLNEGLPHCNGEVVGVLEADDPLSPYLIDRVDGTFRASEVDVVRLAVDVPRTLSTGEILHRTDGLVQVRGRSPVRVTEHYWRGHSAGYFVRTDLLRLLGGWDDDCATAELELMLRLFSYGATGAVLYGKETRVAIDTSWASSVQVRALFRRRVRRHVGLLQIYRTGEWRRIPGRLSRWSARLALILPLVRDLVGSMAVLLTGLLSPTTAMPLAVQLAWVLPLVGLLVTPDFGSVSWLRRQNEPYRWRRMVWLPFPLVKAALDLATRTPAAFVALVRYLRGDTRVLNAHFEHSRHKPPPRHRPPEPLSTPGEVPPDLLDLASSPYTPAAAQTLATGLDKLFTALGPPPEAQRLAGTGPAPKGDGGAGDG